MSGRKNVKRKEKTKKKEKNWQTIFSVSRTAVITYIKNKISRLVSFICLLVLPEIPLDSYIFTGTQ